MRFDFIPFFNPGHNIPWNQTAKMMREQTKIAEDANFNTVWVTEHHFAHNGYLNAPPNPILMSADLGAHFKKIRVGQCPVVLPDWHPLRVAEDIALLDNLTEGRVEFGVGRGINERQSIQFNINADRRNTEKNNALFRESLEIIIKAWTEDPFKFKGDFYEFPVPGWKETNRFFSPIDKKYHNEDGEYKAMYIHPRPYQKPHPPIWLMSNSPQTYEYAGKRGFNVIGMSHPTNKINICWEKYKSSASKNRNLNLDLGENVGVCVIIYVAETMEEAKKDVENSINLYYEFLSGTRPLGEWARKAYLDDDKELTTNDKNNSWFDFLMDHELIWVGNSEYIREKISKSIDKINLKHIMLLQQFPGLEYNKVLKSMNLFSEKVIPFYKNKITN